MSSRIFIRNLPPNFSDNELRTHFSTPVKSAGTTFSATVTDSKFLPHKRIGFVGYKTPQDAQRAVDYFNQSYIRLSRISVELAKEATNEELVQKKELRAKRRLQARENEAPDGKRQRTDKGAGDKKEDGPKDEKLKEYLSLMGSTKTRAWANGLDLNAQVADPVVPTPAKKDDLSENEEEYQVISTKKAKPQQSETAQAPTQPEPTPEDQQPEPEEPVENTAVKPISDADWLKSLTKNSSLDDDEGDKKEAEPSAFPEEEEMNDKTVGAEDRMEVDPEPSEETKEEPQQEGDPNIAQIEKSARLFIRNLSYEATEEELTECFSPFGNLESIHVCLDKKTGESKGIAFAQFTKPESAIEAFRALDGTSWQGRILHIIPADPQPNRLNEFDISKLPYKKQQALKMKAEASKRKFNWNALYMNPDAVMASTAKRFAVSKSDILDPTSTDAAVKQALAETHIIQETKEYFRKYGVDLEAFKNQARGDKAILVKNFEFGTSPDALRSLFEQHGTIARLLFPPAGTIAIVEFERPDQASTAFGKLKYSRVGNSLLFLEMAPKDLFDKNVAARIETAPAAAAVTPAPAAAAPTAVEAPEKVSAGALLGPAHEPPTETSSLFVKNLSFTTTTDGLTRAFSAIPGFVSAHVKTKPNPKNPSAPLSMGFGFVEFRTKKGAADALAAMDGLNLDGHKLVLKASNRGMDAAEERRREDNAKKAAAAQTKVVVKNLPFEATKQDVRTLLSAHGQLRSVRVPKKLDLSSRGFAFAEFASPADAKAAMEALRNTHLLGRKLVLQYAAAESVDPDEVLDRMQKKVGGQMEKMMVKNMVGSGQRKKFLVPGSGEDLDEE